MPTGMKHSTQKNGLVIRMGKQDLLLALRQLCEESKELEARKRGWDDFRGWIDKVHNTMLQAFGADSKQEREFMRIEYAPDINGHTVWEGGPRRSVDSLAWFAEGITRARRRLEKLREKVETASAELPLDGLEATGHGENRNQGVARRKLIIMVSSAVYGYQEFLDQIYNLLVSFGYEVWMSHKGTMPVSSDLDTMENCFHAVEKCDLFLGIITGQYGTTIRDGLSATHHEFKRAIELNKPRWFIVDDRVIFARRFLGGMYKDEEHTIRLERDEIFFKGDTSFSNLKLIDMYELAREYKSPGDDVKWVQEYRDPNSAMLFTMAQFGRYLEIEKLLKNRLANTEDIRNRIGKKGV